MQVSELGPRPRIPRKNKTCSLPRRCFLPGLLTLFRDPFSGPRAWLAQGKTFLAEGRLPATLLGQFFFFFFRGKLILFAETFRIHGANLYLHMAHRIARHHDRQPAMAQEHQGKSLFGDCFN